MQSNQQKQSIHCKVTYYNDIRRFIFAGQDYNTLKETISKLFSLKNEFIIKYLDDEAEYVNLDSQNDLMTALEITPNLLRLKIGTSDSPSNVWESEKKQTRRNRKQFPHHQHHLQNHHHHHQHHQAQNCPETKENCSEMKEKCNRNERMEKKLNYLNLCLKDFADDSKLSPQDTKKKQRFLKKKQRLEQRLSNVKSERRVLTPQEEQANATIKNQLWEMRSEVQKIKVRQRELKLNLQNAPDDKEIKAELSQLKERKSSFKNKRRSLREKLQ
jgi:hypothetical protein